MRVYKQAFLIAVLQVIQILCLIGVHASELKTDDISAAAEESGVSKDGKAGLNAKRLPRFKINHCLGDIGTGFLAVEEQHDNEDSGFEPAIGSSSTLKKRKPGYGLGMEEKDTGKASLSAITLQPSSVGSEVVTIGRQQVAFVMNPMASSGGGLKVWLQICEIFTRLCLPVPNIVLTKSSQHASDVAARFANTIDILCVIGGDGTLNDLVNGLLGEREKGCKCALSLIPAGTGNDFSRAFYKGKFRLENLIYSLIRNERVKSNACYMTFASLYNGKKNQRYFINIGSVGVSTAALETLKQYPLARLGALKYAVHGLYNIFVRRRAKIDLSIALDGGEPIQVDNLYQLAFGCGQFFGGGMKVLPEASLSGPQMDINYTSEASKCNLLFGGLARIYFGLDVSKSLKVGKHKCAKVNLTATSSPAPLVEVDGEIVGTLPAMVRVLPDTLDMLVVSPEKKV